MRSGWAAIADLGRDRSCVGCRPQPYAAGPGGSDLRPRPDLEVLYDHYANDPFAPNDDALIGIAPLPHVPAGCLGLAPWRPRSGAALRSARSVEPAIPE